MKEKLPFLTAFFVLSFAMLFASWQMFSSDMYRKNFRKTAILVSAKVVDYKETHSEFLGIEFNTKYKLQVSFIDKENKKHESVVEHRIRTGNSSSSVSLKRVKSKYPINSNIHVLYNPKNPSEAELDLDEPFSGSAKFGIGIFGFGGMVLGLLGIGVLFGKEN